MTTLVNNVRNDDPSVLERAEPVEETPPEPPAQRSLF